MIVECTKCKQPKERNFSGKIGRTNTYRDAAGNRWHRQHCPDCVKDYRKKSYWKDRPARAAKNKKSGAYMAKVGAYHTVYVAPGTKLYPCGSCKAKTPNHYYCSSCYNTMKAQRSVALAEVEFLYG